MLTIAESVAVHSLAILGWGDATTYAEAVAPGTLCPTYPSAPPTCRGSGPESFHATALWLRGAFTGIDQRIDYLRPEGDLVLVDTTMRGRHTGALTVHDGDGTLTETWAPTGLPVAVRQTHWLRVQGGLVVEHGLVSGELGAGFQPGWVPSSPCYLVSRARAVPTQRCAPSSEPAVHN